MQILLTLVVACFLQLDVVQQAPLLDTLDETREIKDLETQTQAFLSSVVQSILPVIAKAQMRLVLGLFGILLESDLVAISRTRVSACDQYDPHLPDVLCLYSPVSPYSLSS